MQKTIGVLLVIFALVFTACDDKDSKEAREYEVQKALDKGDYEKVLSMTSNCGSDEKCMMNRAAAYAGRAGFTVADIIVSLDKDSDDEFYKSLKGTSTANEDLNRSKTTYESVITRGGDRDKVCEKGTNEYKKASYYQQASCFPHGMVVMARSAVLMNGLLDKYDINGTIDINTGDPDLKEIADLINDDLETILNLFGADSADTVQEVEKFKLEVCGGSPCMVDASKLKTYLENH